MPSRFDARGAARPGRVRLPYSATIAFISVLCAVMVGHDLYRTWEDRSRRIDESQREVANLALSAAQHAQDVVQLASIATNGLVERIETDGTGPAQVERLRHLIVGALAKWPPLQSLDVIDEAGTNVAGARPVPASVNASDREFFQYHRTHSGPQLNLSSVLVSRISGKSLIVVSRRIDHPDASFAGVVAATIDVAYFQKFYATLDLGRDGVAALFLNDGTLLVRRPLAEAIIGTARLTIPPFNDPTSTAPNGTAEITSARDGVLRIYAWHRIRGYPLVAGVGLGENEQLAAWRIGAIEHLLATAAVAVLLGFIGVRLVRQVHLLTQAEQATANAAAGAGKAAAQYRLLADNASDMVVTIDLGFARRYVSPGCRDLLGYEPEELLGASPLAIVHPEDTERVAACLRAMAAGQDRDTITCRARHRDGHWVWLEISLKLIRDPATGAPMEICTALRNVTERVEALAALRHSEECFRIVLQSNVAEALYLLDPDGNVESWNAGAERIKGYTAQEAIGRNFAIFFTPEDVASGEPARELAAAREKGHFATESWRIRKDGSRFLACIAIDAIRRDDGTLRGFVKVTLDITNRRIEEEQRAIIIEAAPNGMLIVDEAGIITLANSQVERIFGYPNGSLSGQPVEILVPDAFRLAHTRQHAEFASGRRDHGMAAEQQFPGRKQDGSAVTIEIMMTAVETPRGRIVVAALFDVTERIRVAAERQQAQESERVAAAVALTEARYRGLLEAAPDAMVVVNAAGEIVLLNLRAEQQFGYKRDELLGQKVTAIVPEGFAERLIADGLRSAADALAQQIGTGIELYGRRKDNSDFPIEIMLSPLDSVDGILVTAAIRDITVRKQAEQTLAQTEARYRGLLEAAPDAMVVVNQNGEIVLLNIRAEAEFGYRRDELLGQKVTAIVPEGFAERLVADGLRSAADALAQEIGTGIEIYGRRKDGSDFPIEIMLSPLDSVDGILVTAAIRDITVRKQAEQTLAQTEARYRGLLEAAPDAMVVVNQGGEIVLLNIRAEQQFGYRRDELLGQLVTTIIPEGFAERLIADGLRPAAEALAQQIGTGIELYGRRKDNSDFPIEIMLSPLDSVDGILVTAAIRDISTRKQAEAHSRELSRSNEELEQFAYIASHDLQEPLRMVTSYTQLLAKRYQGKLDADADAFIAFAVDGATRMQRLIKDLLAYSHVGTKGMELANISSDDALQSALTNLRGTIEQSDARITHGPMPSVMADETQLVQLFQNLVGNAIKYHTGDAPMVHVSAVRNSGGRWMFSIRDNGIGIDPQYFEKIFGMFQRLHRRDEFAGTGIGLAICKKIVERHGGKISVESEPAQGSTFHFSLAGREAK